MTKEARNAMTLNEAMAENRKLEEELRKLSMENARLRTELAVVRSEASGDVGEKCAVAAKVVKRSGSEVELDFPGVVNIRLKGPAAERFAGARGIQCEDLPGGC